MAADAVTATGEHLQMVQKPSYRVALATYLGIKRLWSLLSSRFRKTLIRLESRGNLSMPQDGHDARAVANEILKLAHEAGRQLTPMQIIKLVYFAHGWCLAVLRRPLIREQVQAWQYGPVVREVYWAFSRFGRQPITGFAQDAFGAPYRASLRADEQGLLEAVVQGYSHLHAWELSDLTHLPGTPWSETIRKGGHRPAISDPLMQDYFAKALKASHGRATA